MLFDELDDDVLHLVCRHLRLESGALRAVSLCCDRLRRAALPFLFRQVRVQGDWEETEAILERLRELRLVRHVRKLAFHVHLHPTTERRRPSPSLPALLSTTLSDMKCLRHLSLDVPSYYAPLFGNQFRQDRLAMRRVRSAVVAPYCEFVIHFSPNISSVSTNEKWWLDPKGNPALRLITAAGTTVTILEFEAHFDQWTVPLAEALRHALPNVRALTIRGQCPLSKILTIVIKMKSIEKLVLADIDYLDFRRDTKRGTSAEERVAAVVAPRMKALQTLSVGKSTFDVVREKHGAYKGLEKQSK